MKTPARAWMACALLPLLTTGCAGMKARSRSHPLPVRIVVDLQRQDLARSSLLVFTFKAPAHAEEKGALATALCQELLLEKRLFRVAAQDTRSPWNRLGDGEEAQLRTALAEGEKQGFNYILAGEITDYVWGGMNRTRVGLKLRIIDVRTRITVFFAEHRLEKEPQEKSSPLTARLSAPADAPDLLLKQALGEIIDRLE
jgi:hypothetical protein